MAVVPKVLLVMMGLSWAALAEAAVIVWENTGTQFSTNGNWVGNNAPANSLTTDIGSFTDATPANQPRLTANRSINGIRFTAGSGAWTFTGNSGTRVLTLGSSGIVNSSSSTQTFSASNFGLALGANASFVANSGTLQVAAAINNGGFRLTLDGASTTNTISGVISGSGGLTKIGAGTWTLSATNTYGGSTNIGTSGGADGGTLVLGANNILPGNAVNIYGGTLDINTRTDTIGALNLGGGAAGSTANVIGTTGTLTLGGNVTYDATNNPEGASIAANLSLGSANRQITVGNSTNAAIDLTIGEGITYTDTITMGSHTLTIDGAGDTLINAMVGASGDTGGFIKNGTGTVTFVGDRNFYTGTTTVNDGTLLLDTLNSYTDQTIRGNLVIGDGTGAADSATVRYVNVTANNDKIANTSQVTINADGRLDLNDKDDTVGSFILNAGHITTGTGVLQLAGNITTNANASSSVIEGVLSLGSATRTFAVANGGAASDLTIHATINNGAIIKTGAGTMTITGDNTIGYGGTTEVNAGVLNIQNSGALGQSGVNDPLKGTTVANNAALQMQGGITIGTEALTLSGTGVATDGALRSVSGNNTWGGAISLAAAARINTDADLLTLNGAITATNQNLAVGGNGNTTINGAIGTGTGTLTKDGNGTLTLTGNSTYNGTTTINAGVVNIRSDSALGSTGTGTTVANNAALQLQNNITVGNESLSLTGTGVSNDGAMRNISGNNTWGGTVTVATGGARINSDADTLTLAGNITSANQNLTVGGTGNTTVGGVIGLGTGTLTKDGSGTLLLNGANTYTGATTVNDGTLRLGNNEVIDNGSAVTVAGNGVLDVNGKTETIATLAGDGEVQINGGLLATNGSGSTTFSGTMDGPGTFTKGGSGTLTIDNNIGFGGTLNLTAGILQIDVDNAFAGVVNITGGTLRLSSAVVTMGTLNITGPVTLDFAGMAGSTLHVGTLNILSGLLTIINWQNATDFFFADNWTGAVGQDQRAVAPMTNVLFDSYTVNNTTWQSYDDQITPVPEPSTYGAMLMGAGLALFGYRKWRRSRPAQN